MKINFFVFYQLSKIIDEEDEIKKLIFVYLFIN